MKKPSLGLEWYMNNFFKACGECKKKVIVHAFQPKRKIVYAACWTKDCPRYGQELSFRGG